MRIPTAILGSLAAASICPQAQARVIDTSADYTNPDTVPVLIKVPGAVGSDISGYYDLPSSIDLSKYFKEYTSPGPVLTFTVNTPTTTSYGTAVPSTFRAQLWCVDPTPEDEADTDGDLTSDDDDERIVYQNLDLEEPGAIAYTILDAVGHADGNEQLLNGTLFWDISWGSDGATPIAAVAGPYALADDDTSHVTLGSYAMISPSFRETDYTAGTMGIYSGDAGYSFFFNLADNTDLISAGYVATIGKVFDDDLSVLKMVGGATDNYSLATVREVSSTFSYMPLWNTYTDEEFDLYKQPARDDFIQITNVTISDYSGTDPTHGLKFIEDLPMDDDEDYEDTDTYDGDDTTEAENDPNATIKAVFNVSLSADGVFSFKLRDDVALTDSQIGSYPFYYRVYVNDGTNTGLTGTDYYRGSVYVYLYYPFAIYMGDASYDSSVDYSTTDNSDNTWYWFESDTYGWYMEHNFPTYRWVYSYEHGWIYMFGDMISHTDGVNWYNAPLNYPDGTADYNDDEVGWFWTRSDFYPYLYSFKDDGWVYYIKDVDSDSTDDDEEDDYVERVLDKRLFWSYRQKAYITPDGKDTTYSTGTFSIGGRKFGTGL